MGESTRCGRPTGRWRIVGKRRLYLWHSLWPRCLGDFTLKGSRRVGVPAGRRPLINSTTQFPGTAPNEARLIFSVSIRWGDCAAAPGSSRAL